MAMGGNQSDSEELDLDGHEMNLYGDSDDPDDYDHDLNDTGSGGMGDSGNNGSSGAHN